MFKNEYLNFSKCFRVIVSLKKKRNYPIFASVFNINFQQKQDSKLPILHILLKGSVLTES